MRLMRMQDLAEREVEAWPSPTVPQPFCPPSAVAQPLCPPTVPQPGPPTVCQPGGQVPLLMQRANFLTPCGMGTPLICYVQFCR